MSEWSFNLKWKLHLYFGYFLSKQAKDLDGGSSDAQCCKNLPCYLIITWDQNSVAQIP